MHMSAYIFIWTDMHTYICTAKIWTDYRKRGSLAISLHHLKLTVSEMCHKYVFFCSSSSKMWPDHALCSHISLCHLHPYFVCQQPFPSKKKKKKKLHSIWVFSTCLPCFLGEVRKCWIKYCFSLVFMHRTNDHLLDECPAA